MEKYLLPILEEGGIVGAFVVVAVLSLGFFLRNKGWLLGERAKVVSTSDLANLSDRVGQLSSRLTAVERDMQDLPTRNEIHQLELAHTEISGRIQALAIDATATKAAVIRVEDFLINLSKGGTSNGRT